MHGSGASKVSLISRAPRAPDPGDGVTVTERTIARNEARDAILETAVSQLAQVGAAGVHPQDICEQLGLSKALVNYHFGNRDGLIAEAIVVGWERYIAHLTASAYEAGPDPVQRLLAWVRGMVSWSRENPGLAAAVNFPHMGTGIPEPIDPALAQRLNCAGARGLETLTTLVAEARRSLAPEGEDDPGSDKLDAALISWVTLGMSVWAAGEHLPTRQLQVAEFLPAAQDHLDGVIVSLLSRP